MMDYSHQSKSEAEDNALAIPYAGMDPTEIVRAEISRMLSDTLNNAMQELGYFPGIVHALAEVRAELARVREKNAKLIADNTALTRAFAQQQEEISRLKSQISNSDVHIPIIQNLQQQNHHLKEDRDKILHSQSQYLQENRFLHTELERITAGNWHAHNNLIPPSKLMKHQSTPSHSSPITPVGANPPTYLPVHTPESQPGGFDDGKVAEKQLTRFIQLPEGRPSLTFVPVNPAPPPPPPPPHASRSTQSSPRIPTSASLNAWKHYHAIRSGPPPPTRSPISPSVDQSRNRSITLPAYNTTAQSPFTSALQGIPRKWSTPVIDLTQEDNRGAPPGTAFAPVEQRAMKRRRTEDEVPPPGPPSSTHLDMRTIGVAINTLDRPNGALPSTNSNTPPTPVATAPPGGAPPLGLGGTPLSLSPFTQTPGTVMTSEPDTMETNAEEDEEDEDVDMTDIWDENGLVKVELCLEAAFEEMDGKMKCKMCDYRSKKFEGKPAEPMTDTTPSVLVKHCEEEHPAGWGTLRKGNRQEKQEAQPASDGAAAS